MSFVKSMQLLKAAPKLTAPARRMSAICIPSREKISTGEKIGLASIMVVSWLTIPVWVLTHIRQYTVREE